ncbi:MAG: 4Fe-4S dicluster domain-containing protein [Candidatus Eisenbacteria bacterium]|nr:4Fe-4S dicluster domain-containing protein [Candidatus Eisenbacteria bacterium]
MARYAMLTDLRKCVGCEACTAACNAEWSVPAGKARTNVRKTPVKGRFPELSSSVYVAQCNHCDKPTCISVCPADATFKNADGIVQIDRDLCIGCGNCVEACPYDARYMDPVADVADKCDFCAPRIARGEMPVCVTTCTAHAKFFGDLDDPSSEIHRMIKAGKARRIETAAIAIGPNAYFIGKPAQLDLVQSTFPPREPRLPVTGESHWRKVNPLLLAAIPSALPPKVVAFWNQIRRLERTRDV